ncbi:unnamed protein product [Acanthosepion pharaonis]|uniref:Uncharacterized protein n=1 Tax=Acanthosepion pharaonis TaxID=158019 RepID=A0A812EM26_ACAPH|nr:unnamed protein product [Sepia pharaonis]
MIYALITSLASPSSIFFSTVFFLLKPNRNSLLSVLIFFFSFHISGLINLSIIASTPRDALSYFFLSLRSPVPCLLIFFVFIIFPPFFSTLPPLPDILEHLLETNWISLSLRTPIRDRLDSSLTKNTYSTDLIPLSLRTPTRDRLDPSLTKNTFSRLTGSLSYKNTYSRQTGSLSY